MKKFLVETYYTCTFKTVHELDELSEKSMSEIDKDDGVVEVIDVKLNKRKTKKLGETNGGDKKSDLKNDMSVIEKTIDTNLKDKIQSKQFENTITKSKSSSRYI